MLEKARKVKEFLDNLGKKLSDKNLIVFDYRSILFILIMGFLFVFAVTFKLNGSSIGSWDLYVKPGSDAQKTIIGEARGIRSDEWLVQTPFILSQVKLGMPIENPAIGGNKDPLMMSLPVKHYSEIFRPQNWGFFFLDIERGFSFFWNFKVFGLLLSSFLLTMLITRSNFWLSIFGSAWIFFSSFIQWWFSTAMPDMITGAFILVVLMCYLFIAKSKKYIIPISLLSIFVIINFVLFFYPPFQVPLLYLGLVLVFCFIFQNKEYRKEFIENFKERYQILIAIFAFVVTFLFIYYLEIKDTISAITNTVYPGKRVALGGDFPLANLFAGFTGLPRGEKGLPVSFINQCEASNFLLLFPVIILIVFRRLVLGLKNHLLILGLIVYISIFFIWSIVPFPEIFAKSTLLSFAPPQRAMIGFGIANILLVLVFLSDKNIFKNTGKGFVRLGTAFFAIILSMYGLILKSVAPDYFRFRYIIIMVLVFSFLAYLLLKGRVRNFILLIVLVVIIPNILVNPINKGLDFIYKKDVSLELSGQLSDGDNKVAVYGSNVYANFLKASGVNVFNGVSYTPKMKDIEILDPDNEYAKVHNRYAHISLLEAPSGTEKVEFNLISPDSYSMTLDPCSEKIKKIGITLILFTYKPNVEIEKCLVFEKKTSVNEAYLYRVKR